MINIEIWKTLFDDDFDTDKYIYHYTNFENAQKIIESKCLRFSRLGKTNDTSEAKARISYIGKSKDFEKKVNTVDEFFNKNIDYVRTLCFSTDITIKKDKKFHELKNNRHRQYCDISRRGFALPRMWAQYAENNEGVCLIVNKEKLESKFKKKAVIHKSAKVKYKQFFENYQINEEKQNEIYEKINPSVL